MSKYIEIENTETKYFKVLKKDRVDKRKYGGRSMLLHFYWAECKRCGRVVSVRKQYLLGNRNQSCGCITLVSGEAHRDWQGVGELSKAQFSEYAHSAAKRNLEFSVTIEYLWSLFLDQNRLCSLTGLPLVMGRKKSNKGALRSNASLDRIENGLGYVIGNVRWVTIDVNLIKRTLTDEQLIYYCKLIVLNQGGDLTVTDPPSLDSVIHKPKPSVRKYDRRNTRSKTRHVMDPRWWHGEKSLLIDTQLTEHENI